MRIRDPARIQRVLMGDRYALQSERVIFLPVHTRPSHKNWSALVEGWSAVLYECSYNRHWGAFAEKFINNRTLRHDTKGIQPIVYCIRKIHLWGSKLHAIYSIPLCFYLGWNAYLGTMSKIRFWPYHNGYMTCGAPS